MLQDYCFVKIHTNKNIFSSSEIKHGYKWVTFVSAMFKAYEIASYSILHGVFTVTDTEACTETDTETNKNGLHKIVCTHRPFH